MVRESTLKRRGLGPMLLAVLAAVALLIAQRQAPTGTRRDGAPPPVALATVPTLATAQAAIAGGTVAFVPNLGQWDGPFSHKARMGAMTVFLQERGWTFTLVERPQRHELDPFALRTPQPEPASAPARGVAVRMHFEGGADPALPVEEQRLPGVHNYFLGNDPDRWRSKVPLHGAVLLSALYPGIDLRARSQDDHFEYDLLLEPGADLEQVIVTVEGADGLRLDSDGALIIDTALGPVRQPLPKTWQVTASGERQAVACSYALRGARTFVFEARDWDHDLALVVDPGLVYSTYLGGSGDDPVFDLALEANGAATVCGQTDSPNFPTTAGAFDTTYGGGARNAFVTRLDPSGSILVYSTFLDGALAFGLALDPTGAATICGAADPNLPTTPGAYDTSFNGGVLDAFVTRLDPSGSALVYSTYLGGSDIDRARGIALDATGAAIVCGTTHSANFPTTAGAFDTTYNGSNDAFVTRLNPSGSALVYSSYIGSPDFEVASAVVLDATGAATVCGPTDSPNFPTTAGAFDTTYNGGLMDAFVTRLDPSGGALAYSTYLGGSGWDDAYPLALDAAGAVTVGGLTSSPNFPTTAGAFDTTYNGGTRDAFVTRLNPSGSALAYSTFLGGSDFDRAGGIALDATGAATVGGSTSSPNFPTTAGAFDTTYNGSNDAFVTRLNPSGSALAYSTFLGGSGWDDANSLALDAAGAATVGGSTPSPNFPTTAGAFDTNFNGVGSVGTGDAFITHLDMLPTGVAAYGSSSPGCTGPLAIGVTSWPQVGNSLFSFTCGNGPPLGTGILGISDGSLAAPINAAGALIWIDPFPPAVLVLHYATCDAAGAVETVVPIPANPTLAGLQAFAQYVWYDPCAPTGYTASNALAITVQP